ncbi:MAG TPA: S-layer homology domain-containing protein [Bacillus sp. (in: firmicutes)]|nr:S-layer homology domain-containing protein [Bacillus sp. (in: firmicutes)]
MKKTVTSLLLFITLLIPFHSVSAATTFSDVPSDYWAYKEISFLVEQQIIKGYQDGRFGPNDPIKRMQAAEMLVKALGLSTENRPNPNFKDIKPGDYGYEIAATVADEGIMTGSNGYFNPWKPLTRGQMAKILGEAYGLEYVFDADFTDVSPNHWAFGYVSALLGNAITTGYPDQTYRPDQLLTRAQFSVFMARILDDSFKPTLFYLAEEAEYEWGEDDSLTIHVPVYNNYDYAVNAIKSNIAIVQDEEVIAEGFFEFDPAFSINSKDTVVVTLTFGPEYVYNVTELDQFEIYAISEVGKK